MTLWTDELDTIWINEMIHQANVLGKRSNSGFKKEAWTAALAKLNAAVEPGSAFTMLQLKTRNTSLKEKFSVVWSMANSSGMGFERSRSLVVCISTTWDDFLAGKSDEIKKWKNRPFPLFDLCEVLYSGSLARGKHVLSTNMPITQTPTIWNNSDDDASNQVSDLDENQENGPMHANFSSKVFDQGAYHDQDNHDSPHYSNTDRRHSKRRRTTQEESPPKRVRPSSATVLASELRSQNGSLSKELHIFSKALMGENVDGSESKVEMAISCLQDEFEGLLEDEETLTAIDVLAIESNAKIFLKLKGSLRDSWLRRQIFMANRIDNESS
ncbi:hypothetical protein AC1031_018833 [Aphanomyces cochlioides]|nr:hypothetical protein AC1031_018833 [Aphanomyces cochlioides]